MENQEEKQFDSALDTLKIMEVISIVLKEGHGLECEILAFAFQELKQHPEKDIEQVISNAFHDWVK